MSNSVRYQDLLHDVALRINAMVGSTYVPLEVTYSTAVLSLTNLDSADFPFSSLRDGIIRAEGVFAQAISNNRKSPLRQYLRGLSSPVASGLAMPLVDSNGKPVIGIQGDIFDSSTMNVLLPQPMDVITRFLRGSYSTAIYYYCINGATLYHTVTSAVVEICKYSQSDQLNAFAINGTMLLPDAMRAPIADLAVSMFTRDTVYESQAQVYAGYAAATLAQISQGMTPGDAMAA